MHTLSEYEDASIRVGRQITECLDKLRLKAEEEARSEHRYKVAGAKAMQLLQVENPKLAVKARESESFLRSESIYLHWRLVLSELTTLKLELRAYMAKLDVLRSLMSAHRAEAEFVRKER